MPRVLATILGINVLRLCFCNKNKTTLLKGLENTEAVEREKSPALFYVISCFFFVVQDEFSVAVFLRVGSGILGVPKTFR